MTPLGWGWALFVWGYALVWFVLNDRIKLLAYRIFDRGKHDAKSKAKANASSDLRPEIAKRAYELYEQHGRLEGHAAEDWAQAERGLRQDETKAVPAAEVAVQPKRDAKGDPKAETKAPVDPEPQLARPKK